MLVYGALATLGLILVVAVYALATKGSIQTELERKLDELKRKEEALQRNVNERQAAVNKAEEYESKLVEEGKRAASLERETDQYKHKAKEVEHERDDYMSESEILRRKLWDKTDQESLEKLEKLSEEDLMKQLEEEGAEFFSEAKELENEHVDKADKADFDSEVEKAKEFQKAVKLAKEKLHEPGDAGDEDALEGLEELGEQNEVMLDELDRDAVRNAGGKWKDKKRPGRMGKLAHDMDLRAEALRVNYARKKLHEEDKSLDTIEKEADKEAHEGKNGEKEFAPAIENIAKEVEADEERVLKELDEADERDEFDAAKMLERDTEEGEVKLASLKQSVHDSKLTPEQKREREELIAKLDKELHGMENEAQQIEKGLERRNVRKDAVKMAKAANRLGAQPQKNLKHGKAVQEEVGQVLRDESGMLAAMKKDDTEGEEKYGAKLSEEAEELEEDAEHLFDEADAGDFDDLDEKLIDEQLAKELEEASQDMDQDAGGVDNEDRAREVREAGEHIKAEAQKFGETEKQFNKTGEVKEAAEKVERDAHQLAQAVGEQDWEAEAQLAQKAVEDASHLDVEAEDLNKEVVGAPVGELPDVERKEDLEAIKEMKVASASLKKEAQSIQKDVKDKAKVKGDRLREKISKASKLAEAA